MIPQIYLRRGDDDDLTEAQSDSCRNWLFRAGQPAPRIWEDGDDGYTVYRDLMIEDILSGKARLLVIWSLDTLAPTRDDCLRLLGRLWSVGADIVVMSPPMDLRGRTEASTAQKQAIQAIIDFRPLIEGPPPKNPGGRPRTEFTDEQHSAVRAHLADHGRRNVGALATKIGVTARQAARLLAEAAAPVVVPVPVYRFRAGDVVQHGPSGEEWVLACDEDENSRVMPCGWPESMAEAKDCTLKEAADDEDRIKMLAQWSRLKEEKDARVRKARWQLSMEPSRLSDHELSAAAVLATPT